MRAWLLHAWYSQPTRPPLRTLPSMSGAAIGVLLYTLPHASVRDHEQATLRLCPIPPFVTLKPPTESSCSTPSGPQTPRRRARRRGRRLVICRRAAPRLLRCRKLAATQSATRSLFLSIGHCYLLPSSWLPEKIYRERQVGGGSTMQAEAFFPRVSRKKRSGSLFVKLRKYCVLGNTSVSKL